MLALISDVSLFWYLPSKLHDDQAPQPIAEDFPSNNVPLPIYNAVQKLPASRMYDFVLDKSGGITVIFSDPKLDKSEEILASLGVKK